MKTLINYKSILGVTTLSLVLTGCFNSSSSNNNVSPSSQSKALATQSPDSKPGRIDDPVALRDDINATFGNPDDEPVDIETGETLGDLFDRVGS